MNPLFVAAVAVQELCRERDWGFCFIGGLAVLRWGEPCLTRDIDLTILAGLVPRMRSWTDCWSGLRHGLMMLASSPRSVDRMLAAQSELERLPLVTKDPAFGQFGVATAGEGGKH